MYIIGVTGYSGSGKTEFSKFLARQNPRVYAYDLDDVATSLAGENKEWLVKKFGKNVFKPNGSFDYNYYCSCEKSKRQQWRIKRNAIINERFNQTVYALEALYDIFIVDGGTLPAMTIWEKCDKKVLITSNIENRYIKLETRAVDSYTPTQAKIRDANTIETWGTIGTDYITIHNDYTQNFENLSLDFLNNIFKEIEETIPIIA